MSLEDDDLFAPIPVEDGWVPLPLAFLPQELAHLCRWLADDLGCDPAFLLQPALAAVGAAVGKGTLLRLKDGWVEAANPWTALVAPPGSKKTPAARQVLDPIRELDKAEREKHRRELEGYEANLAAWRGIDKKHQKDSPQPKRPVLPRIEMGDFTVEALARALGQQPRGVLIFLDELRAILDFDRYRDSKGGSDESRLNSLWSRETLIVDRKKDDEPTIVEEPFVALCGNLVPKGLRDLSAHDASGLFARFLLAWPPPPPNAPIYKRESTREAMEARANWRTLIRAVRQKYCFEGTIVELDEEAKTFWEEWVNRLEERKHRLDETDPSRAFRAKLPSHVARIALALYACKLKDDLMDKMTLDHAINLGEWFEREHLRILAQLAGKPDADSDRALIRWLRDPKREGRLSKGSMRDLVSSGPRPRPKNNAEAQALLQRLVDQGLGHREEDGTFVLGS